MDYLTEAKQRAERAWATEGAEWAQLDAQLAIAHALIAICERMDKAVDDTEVAVEREDLIRERLASRQASERIL